MGASYAIVNNLVQEGFTVTNRRNRRVSGIPTGQFTYDLYDPSDAVSALPLTFTELGSGNYRAEFTPDTVGDWYLIVYHPRYFPWGKSNDIKVQTNDAELARKFLTNKQTLEKDADDHFVQTIYDDDESTPLQVNDLTCDGDTETREPR
jgi:hypothetical protein